MNEHDGILLDRWESTGDNQAFMELVARYQGMVFGTCLRIVRDAAMAEDLVQECFLKLTRSRPRNTQTIGPWLHRIATNTALDSRRSDLRRAGREAAYFESRESSVEPRWHDVEEMLDEELLALPEKLRAVIVSHYLEGHTQVEVASLLAIPRTTVSSRLQKGLDHLRTRLSARGVSLPAAALGAMLVAELSHAAPPTLTVAMGKAVLRGVFVPGPPATSRPHKLLVASAVAAMILLLFIGARGMILDWFASSHSSVASSQTAADTGAGSLDVENVPEAPVSTSAIPEPPATEAVDVVIAAPKTDPAMIQLRCVDESGDPVSGVLVYVYQSIDLGAGLVWGNERTRLHQADGPLESDSDGHISFAAFAGPEGRTPRRSAFAIDPGERMGIWEGFYRPIADMTDKDRTLTLVPSQTVSGQVLVPEGYEVSNVLVDVYSIRLPQNERMIGETFGSIYLNEEPVFPGLFDVQVESDGRFKVSNLPAEGFFSIRGRGPGLGERQESIRDASRVGFMELGLEAEGAIEGTVVDTRTGKPVANRNVYCQLNLGKNVHRVRSGTTDSLGRYRIDGLSAGTAEVVVGIDADPPTQIARGRSSIQVETGRVTGDVDFELEPGVLVSGMMTHQETGEPIAGVAIGAINPATKGTCINAAQSDENGHYELRLPLGDTRFYIAGVPKGIKFPEDNERVVSVNAPHEKQAVVDFTFEDDTTDWSAIGRATITGRVLDLEGKPAAGVLITESHTRPMGPREITTGGRKLGETDGDGQFRIELRTMGSYKITFGGYGWSAAETDSFTLVKDESKDLGEFRVRRLTSKLSIQVLDEEGAPLPDVFHTVYAKDFYWPSGNQTSDVDGMIHLEHLPNTELSISFSHTGYVQNRWKGFAGGHVEITMKRE